MRVSIATALLLSCAVSAAVAAPDPAPAAAPYSDEPLAAAPLMSQAQVAADLTTFTSWLNENEGSIAEANLPGTREHAYLLIDSILKIRHAAGRRAFNEFEHRSLVSLFDWATALNVYGAGLVARELADGRQRQLRAPLLPTAPLRLRLENGFFIVSADDAPWRLTFPYYFMIWNINRFAARNGFPTDMVVASTSFGEHADEKGRSQATIMFVYSPGVDCDAFGKYWLAMLQLAATTKSETPRLPQAQTFVGTDRETRIRKEATMLAKREGCYGLIYTGIQGTFEANSVSWADFLRTLRTEAAPMGEDKRPKAPADKPR